MELVVITIVTISSWSLLFANLTGLNQDLYRENTDEVAQALLSAMQNPAASLKQWNIISIRSMDLDVENSFAKWYCTYGAARVSPEFFPFIDEKTQQRTWWGNAVDRCKNASDTWYKIWLVPNQWALIIYNAGGKFGSYGHVGKVLHYDAKIKKIIVRDMAWVARWMMSDRREDLTTANVECYIYNSRTTLPANDTSEIHTWTIINTWTVSPVLTWITSIIAPTPVVTPLPVVTHPTAPTTPPAVVTPVQPIETPVVQTPVIVEPTIPAIPVVIEPIVSTDISQSIINKELSLELDDALLSDIAQHFLTQNDLTITFTSKSPLKIGETAIVTLEIKDKKSGEKYAGLLPFAFSILSTSDILQPDISTIQLINNGFVDISILAQKSWTASIVITMDGTKIGEASFDVK